VGRPEFFFTQVSVQKTDANLGHQAASACNFRLALFGSAFLSLVLTRIVFFARTMALDQLPALLERR
jgi:hypothetical protein